MLEWLIDWFVRTSPSEVHFCIPTLDKVASSRGGDVPIAVEHEKTTKKNAHFSNMKDENKEKWNSYEFHPRRTGALSSGDLTSLSPPPATPNREKITLASRGRLQMLIDRNSILSMEEKKLLTAQHKRRKSRDTSSVHTEKWQATNEKTPDYDGKSLKKSIEKTRE